MNAMQWSLVALGFALPSYLFMRWLRWNTRLPIFGRAQDVRKVMRRQTQYDVEAAVEEALSSARLESVAGSGGPASRVS